MVTAIVAIPEKDDPVWKLSSEKVPHLTILALADNLPGPTLAKIETFMQHLVDTSLRKFGLNVGRRGTLGPLNADVLFFEGYGIKCLKDARTYLLAENDIRDAYNAVEQFPEFTPHLTMGYPEIPAHEDTREYPHLNYIHFDRIALWIDNYDGPEFELKDEYSYPVLDLAYSDMPQQFAFDEKGNVVQHHGIRGQKWGVRRKNPIPTGSSEDHVTATTHKQTIKKTGGTHTLSNKDLQSVVTRMNLEQQYSRLSSSSSSKSTLSKGNTAVKGILSTGKTINDVLAFKNSPAGKLLAEQLKAKVK